MALVRPSWPSLHSHLGIFGRCPGPWRQKTSNNSQNGPFFSATKALALEIYSYFFIFFIDVCPDCQ